VHLFALGKAAPAMSAAALEVLRGAGHELGGGVIVAAAPARSSHALVEALEGDHPLPGPRSFSAAQRLGVHAAAVRDDHVAIVLLSGGATSLVAAPSAAHDERDLVRLFELLHRSGLDIHAMNVIRKRFTRWGAGRLALALRADHTNVLAISDVPGDEPADIASGPCAPDPSTAHDVIALLRAAGMLAELPTALREHLDAVRRGDRAETPKPTDSAFARVSTSIIGSNRLAVEAAVVRARSLPVDAERIIEPLRGEAAQRGDDIAAELLARAAAGRRGCVVWGGETTVRRSDATPALGGRCQELALAAARRLAAAGDASRGIALLAAGTDGRDGPTDAAGGYADAFVWAAAVRAGVDPGRALARHESYSALDAAAALLRRGPTGTNVMDVVIGVVE
jgi:hydroxypyruvate reductase